MKNEGVPIVREGWPFLSVTLLAALAFFLGDLWAPAIAFLILSGFMGYFFRNPERLPPIGTNILASPADGRVVSVGLVTEKDFTGEEMQRISIFLSVFDVHVNRVPVDGTVKNMKYHRGRFMAAFEEHASEENERNVLLIETTRGEKTVVAQIAGLIARRIVCYPSIGAFILKGQRFGLIRFGSRTDLFVPKSARVLVKVGDRVLGGETPIAQLKEA